MEAKVIVQVELNPTEDESKVIRALSNLIDVPSFTKHAHGNRAYIVLEGDASLLSKLRALLRRERILDAARKVMLAGVEGSTITFHLNKQVAYAGHVSFCMPEGESPLGPITFHIKTEDPKLLIDWLATKTIDGVPVDELWKSGSQHFAQSERRSR
ncbi:MAG: RNA-binding domain-containing protein [Candidatus Methanomethylicaceae archaeon]|nr:RNA-binding domain-containing protein [Candidatus Verstraetearchaeota archaeon]